MLAPRFSVGTAKPIIAPESCRDGALYIRHRASRALSDVAEKLDSEHVLKGHGLIRAEKRPKRVGFSPGGKLRAISRIETAFLATSFRLTRLRLPLESRTWINRTGHPGQRGARACELRAQKACDTTCSRFKSKGGDDSSASD